MKKFNKKAVFAALMGALSVAPSLAMECKPLHQIRMYRNKSEKNYRFLKNLRLLKKDDPDLEEIFTQMATMYYENFDELYFNPGFVINNLRKKDNLKKLQFSKIETWSRNNQNTNPGYDVEDKLARNKAQEQWKYLYQGSFEVDNNYNVLIHMGSGGHVDGFIYFELDKEEKNIHIRFLVTKPSETGSGIAGQMLKTLLSSYNWAESFTLDADNANAESFFKHFGFEKHNPKNDPSLRKRMILQKVKK